MLIHTGVADYMSCHFDPKPYLADGMMRLIILPQILSKNYNHKAWGWQETILVIGRILSGTDIHSTGDQTRNLVGMAGVAFPYRIESVQHFVDAFKGRHETNNNRWENY